MCGIVGWADFAANLEQERETITKMTRTLAHRGPDDEGIWCDRHVAFGHRRLAVVDLEGGRQPFERDGYVITYNGELYNTEELRKELVEEGYTFTSYCDTEVLLVAYIAWGENCLEKLNGIFAFGIWNPKRQLLFLARDRLGVKPLFFARFGSSLLFASEQKAILAHPRKVARVDETGLAELLSLGPTRTPGHGIFVGVEELRPGHMLMYTKEGGCDQALLAGGGEGAYR